MEPEKPPEERPLISRMRDRVLGRRTARRDAAMSAMGIVGRIEVAKFEDEPLLTGMPPQSDTYVDVPWELRDE